MVFIDGPGHGASDPQRLGATLDTHASAVIDMMEYLRADRCVFAGTSWGGLVGARLAMRFPERVSALIALNTPFDTVKGGPSFSARLIVLLARFAGKSGLFAGGVAGSFFSRASQRSRRDDVDLFQERLFRCAPAAMAEVARTVLLDRQSQLPSLGRITVPTWVVAGSDDLNVSVEDLQQAAALIPDSRFVTIPDTAHLSALEASEQVSRLILDVCREVL